MIRTPPVAAQITKTLRVDAGLALDLLGLPAWPCTPDYVLRVNIAL